jgi:predicted permease
MKAEKIFTIATIATFFALLPALIIMEVRVLREMPEISYLFIIADILLIGFIGLEIFLLVRKWKKDKEKPSEKQEPEIEKIDEEWNEEKEVITKDED